MNVKKELAPPTNIVKLGVDSGSIYRELIGCRKDVSGSIKVGDDADDWQYGAVNASDQETKTTNTVFPVRKLKFRSGLGDSNNFFGEIEIRMQEIDRFGIRLTKDLERLARRLNFIYQHDESDMGSGFFVNPDPETEIKTKIKTKIKKKKSPVFAVNFREGRVNHIYTVRFGSDICERVVHPNKGQFRNYLGNLCSIGGEIYNSSIRYAREKGFNEKHDQPPEGVLFFNLTP